MVLGRNIIPGFSRSSTEIKCVGVCGIESRMSSALIWYALKLTKRDRNQTELSQASDLHYSIRDQVDEWVNGGCVLSGLNLIDQCFAGEMRWNKLVTTLSLSLIQLGMERSDIHCYTYICCDVFSGIKKGSIQRSQYINGRRRERAGRRAYWSAAGRERSESPWRIFSRVHWDSLPFKTHWHDCPLSLSHFHLQRSKLTLRIKAIDNDKKGHQYSYTRYPSRQIYGKDYEAQLEV